MLCIDIKKYALINQIFKYNKSQLEKYESIAVLNLSLLVINLS